MKLVDLPCTRRPLEFKSKLYAKLVGAGSEALEMHTAAGGPCFDGPGQVKERFPMSKNQILEFKKLH